MSKNDGSVARNNTNTDVWLAGAFAAVSVDILVYPLDTIKTRIQAPDYAARYTDPVSRSVNRSLFRGLYQGVGSVVLATVPSSGAFFTTYEASKALLDRVNPVRRSTGSPIFPTPLLHSIASCAGELVSCLILTPAEVLKQNAQIITTAGTDSKKDVSKSSLTSSSSSSSSSLQSRSRIFDHGATRQAFDKFRRQPSQLWRGYTALVGRNLPFTGMQFPMFEQLKARMLASRRRRGRATGSLLERAYVTSVAAGAAGSVAAVVTTPIDVVKTRIMLAADRSSSNSSNSNSIDDSGGRTTNAAGGGRKSSNNAKGGAGAGAGASGGFAIAREIYRAEGARGLFRGAALRGVWTVLGSGLYLGVYETGRAYLEMRRLS